MGFKEVASLDAEVTIAIGKTDKNGKAFPKQAEGYYLGSRTVESKRGESKLHFLQTAKGNLGVWGTTDLNRKLLQAPVGTMVRITSTGTKPTPNGDMYTYRVEQDTDNTIEVANLEAGSATSASDETFVNEDDNDDEDVEAEVDAVAERAAAEARKAAVLARLNGNKSKTR